MATETFKYLSLLINGDIKDIAAENVRVKASGKAILDHIDAKVKEAVDAVKAGDIGTLQSELSALDSLVKTFLEGDIDGGAIDRLKEIVKALEDHGGDIETLLGKAHEHGNSELLDAITANSDGDYILNGHVVDGKSDIAIVTNATQTPTYDGKLIAVVEEIEYEVPTETDTETETE